MDIEPSESNLTPFEMLVDIEEQPNESHDSAMHESPRDQRYDTLGFICLENVPDEDEKIKSPRDSGIMVESAVNKYNFTPRAYNLKPKRLSELNSKSEVILKIDKSLITKFKKNFTLKNI